MQKHQRGIEKLLVTFFHREEDTLLQIIASDVNSMGNPALGIDIVGSQHDILVVLPDDWQGFSLIQQMFDLEATTVILCLAAGFGYGSGWPYCSIRVGLVSEPC